MAYKIIDKNTNKNLVDFSFEWSSGYFRNLPAYISCHEDKALIFNSKQDAEITAKKLGDNFKVVEI